MRFTVFGIFGGYGAFIVDCKSTFKFAACGKLPNFRPRFVSAVGNRFAALVDFDILALRDQFFHFCKEIYCYGHNGQVVFAFLVAFVIAV